MAAFVYVLEIAALVGFLFTKPAWHLIIIGGIVSLFGYDTVISRLHYHLWVRLLPFCLEGRRETDGSNREQETAKSIKWDKSLLYFLSVTTIKSEGKEKNKGDM